MFSLLALCCLFVFYAEATNDPLGIVKGHPAPKGAYPWMVSLTSGCGGVLIDKRHILTAAHCIVGNRLQAKIGIYYRNDPRFVDISGTRKHPKYVAFPNNTMFNDIAIIRLKSPVDNAYPTLAYNETTNEDCSTKHRTKLMGWGTTVSGQQVFPEMLMEANNVAIVTNRPKKCLLDKVIYCPLKSQICAHDPQKEQDSDQGDSGGPMLIEKNGKLALVGLVSYGQSVAFAACYTCVPFFQDWIKKQIAATNW